MKTNLWILIIGILLFSSCLDDEGNYSYSELNPIEIDSTEILNSYRVTQFDYLVIDPAVKQGTDDSNLTYEWRIFQSNPQPNPEIGRVVNDVVGTERKLNYKVQIPIGNYKLSFKAFDRQNGVFETILRDLTIESFAPVGLMVMHGDTDSTDVSILVNDRIVPDATKDEVQHNIFSQTNGHRVAGAPGMVRFTWGGPSIYVCTKGSDGGCLANASNLGYARSYAEMFDPALSSGDIDFQSCVSKGSSIWMVNNGIIYQATNESSFVCFGAPVFGEPYYAEPYIATTTHNTYRGVFYDRLQRRFLYCHYTGVVAKFKDAGASAAFDMNHVGEDMLFADRGFEDKWLCVMHNPENPDKYSVHECNLANADDGNCGVGKYDISDCTGIQEAHSFAFGKHNYLLYYALDTEIRMCNFKTASTSIVRYSLPDDLAQAGYKINLLYLYDVNGDSYGKNLYVGIYNPTTEEGKLLECPIVVTDGEILADKIKTYDGFKKIAHLSYKDR